MHYDRESNSNKFPVIGVPYLAGDFRWAKTSSNFFLVDDQAHASLRSCRKLFRHGITGGPDQLPAARQNGPLLAPVSGYPGLLEYPLQLPNTHATHGSICIPRTPIPKNYGAA